MASAPAFPIKVPSVKYKIARDYQQEFWTKNNVMLPLWRCLIDTEMREMKQNKNNDPFKHIRRGFKL